MAGPIPIETEGNLTATTVVFSKGGIRYVAAVAKATFAMIHEGYAAVAPPEEIARVDVATPGLATLDRAVELAPYLPKVDVYLRGHVRARAGEPSAAVAARLVVYGRGVLLDKTVHAYGDRDGPDEYPREFVALPLVFELARADASDNPVGLSDTDVPNLVMPAGDRGTPCFAPVPPSWPTRALWTKDRDPPPIGDEVDLPDDFDFAFYQAALPDQQIEAVGGDEWIILDGMHPDLERFATRLPSASVTAELKNGSDRVHVFDMVCDTVSIDADARTVSLVFRGNIPLPSNELSEYKVAARISLGESDPTPTPDDDEIVRKTLPPRERADTPPLNIGLETESHVSGEAPPNIPLAAGLPFIAPSPDGSVAPPPVSRSSSSGVQPSDPPTPSFDDELTPSEVSVTAPPKPSGLPSQGSGLPFQPPAPAEPSPEATASSFKLGEITLAGLGAKSARIGSVPARAPGSPAPASSRPAPPAHSSDRPEPPAKARPAPPPASLSAESPPVRPAQVVAASSSGPMAARAASTPAAPAAAASESHLKVPDPPPSLSRPRDAARPPLLTPKESIPSPAKERSASSASPSAPPKPVEETGARGVVLARLKAGEALYNANYAGADLSGIDFSNAALTGINLAGAKLERCNFEGARLSGAKLTGADLRNANLRSTDLAQADLSRATLDGARFDKAAISDANFTLVVAEGALFDEATGVRVTFAQGKWIGASFRQVDLGSADLSGAEISRASFDGAKLPGARFSDAHGEEASFVEAVLDQATFTGASLKRSVFDKSSLKGSSWERAMLEECSFRNARMDKSIVARATLNKVVFAGAELEAANFIGATGDASDFSGAKLCSCDFRQTKLGAVSFERADLAKANAHKAVFSAPRFSGAKLGGASFRGAKMKGATFSDADLGDADLRDADLENARFKGAKNRASAKLGGANLRGSDEDAGD